MGTGVTDDDVAAVRGFNRFYTRSQGLLGPGFLGSDHNLTEVRVLYELNQHDEVELVDLRSRTDIDAGYLSRMLNRFADDGLIERARSATDGRRQVARLTAAGREHFAVLEQRQRDVVGELLGGLDEAQRRRLLGSMQAIESLLSSTSISPNGGAGTGSRSGSGSPTVVIRSAGPGDLGLMVQRHGALYHQAYGWDQTYEALVARVTADMADARAANPGRVEMWIAEIDGQPVGSICCTEKDADTAQLRLLLVEPSARQQGLGGRLIDHCLRFATQAGYRRIVLWTNDILLEARRLYEKAGFTLDAEEPHHSWGHDNVGQYWSRDL
jgi:DNA-binding MarR family transcriptional regulator/GNAT superfamily N-acetyltransferase